MKLSTMSYTFSRQREHFDLQRMLRLTRELGLDGIDFVTLHGYDPEDLRRMCDDLGIRVVCHTLIVDLNFPDEESRRPGIEACKRGLEAAVVLGAPVVMIPTPAKRGQDSTVARANWIAGLKEVAPLAADAGVTLTVENFPGRESPFVTADHLLEAVEAVPGLKITFDNGNAATGEDPVESFARSATYVVHAHFKDWDVRDEPAEGFRRMMDGRYYRPALIGEGVIDHASCLAVMAKVGYKGYIDVEYEGDKYDPYEATRRAVDYLRGLEPSLA